MSILKKYIKIIRDIIGDPLKRFLYFTVIGVYNRVSDYKYINRRFYLTFGYHINWDNPKTFNEKIQWLKLNGHEKDNSEIVDKYEVKKYVEKCIGEEYIIPTYGVWSKFEDIDFEQLPNQFVLKCTHDSGGLVIVTDKNKLDLNYVRKRINKCLKRNYYFLGRELPYKEVVPRIIAERYMEDPNSKTGLIDYKYMCFNGKVKSILVCSDRFSLEGPKMTFYDEEWNVLPFRRKYAPDNISYIKPVEYEKMKNLAETLAQGTSFLRVDFYEINSKIYFGELTLYPGSGFEHFVPFSGDEILGEWLHLPM